MSESSKFLSLIFILKLSKLNCLLNGFSSRKVSQRDSSSSVALFVLVCAHSADYRKNLWTIQVFFLFFHCCHKMKYSCYQDSSNVKSWFVYLGFGLRKLCHGIQQKWKLNMQAFTAEHRKSFWPRSLSGAASKASLSNNYSGSPWMQLLKLLHLTLLKQDKNSNYYNYYNNYCFCLVLVKSGVIISCRDMY